METINRREFLIYAPEGAAAAETEKTPEKIASVNQGP